MNVFKRFLLKVKKFFSKFTKQKNDDPASCQGAVPSSNDEPRSTQSAEPSHIGDPASTQVTVPSNNNEPRSSQSAEPSHIDGQHVSQRTIPSHSHDQSSDKALSRIISIVEVADNVVEDISVPGLKSAVKVLLNALKKIKVYSKYIYFYPYIMC